MTGSRQPRYTRFVGTGAAVGVLVALAVVVLADTGDARYSTTAALLYTGLLFGLVGSIAGGGVAVLFDRRGAAAHDRKGVGDRVD